MSMRLAGKSAIITGAGRGIGAALAVAFAQEGAKVAVNYSRSVSAAREVVSRIEAAGGTALSVPADVGDIDSHDGLVKGVLNAYGAIDILVNNAAIDRRGSCLETTPAQWDEVFAVDLKGPYFLTQRVVRWMVEQNRGGAILNISSVHDEQAHRNNSLYTIAKGGMKLMTRNLALELAQYGIRVNSLSPGAILTDMNRHLLADPTFLAQVTARIPLGRIGACEEIAPLAVFLVSDEASYITGSTYYADGGLLL